MKKLIALLLASIICLTLFVGCGTAFAEEADVSKNVYPLSGSLTFWLWANGNVTANYPSFEVTPAAAYAEEATGVKIDYIDDHSNTDEAFQLMSTSDKLPDMIGHGWSTTYNGGIVAAHEDGLCIRLNEVIDNYMPNFKALIEAEPSIKKMISDDDGNIYFIPNLGAQSSLYTYGSYFRKDMLEKVGTEIPTTIDGWHDLLVSVKNEFNIVPFTTTWADLLTKSFVSYAYGVGESEYTVWDGKVVYNRTSDNYKAFLQTLNTWFNEGLLDPDIATIATADSRAKIINGEAFVSGGWLGSALQPIEQASDDWGIQAFATPASSEVATPSFTYASWPINGNGVVITPDCENIELAARWLDYFFSKEGILLYCYGKEGESYTIENGFPVFTDNILYNFAEGWTQSQSISSVNFAVNGFTAGQKDENYYPQTIVEQSCKEAINIWSSIDGGGHLHKWPTVSYTADEAVKMSRYSSNLKTTADEWALNFIIGTTSFDQWDTYVAEMEALGATQALEINQSALDRYNAR